MKNNWYQNVFNKTMVLPFVLTIGLFSCENADHKFDNPVDPKNTVDQSSPSDAGGTEQTAGDSGNTGSSSTSESGVCLTDNCNSPATPTINLTNATWFSQSSSCSVGTGAIVLKSLYLSRFTILYRANYASAGLWQLYALGFTVSADGTMAADANPVNLFPSCYGNASGVTAFSVTEYKDGTTTTARRLNFDEAENVSDFVVSVTCVNNALSGSVKFGTAAGYSTSTANTLPFMNTLGAYGYWAEKSVYLKADGTSLNADGTAGNVIISMPSGKTINSVVGSDSTGVYLAMSGPSCYFVSSSLQVSSSTICGYTDSGANYGIWNDPTYGTNTLVNRYSSNYSRLYIEHWQNNSKITSSQPLGNNLGNNIKSFLLTRNNKILAGDYYNSQYQNSVGYVYHNYLGTLNLSNGTFTTLKTSFIPMGASDTYYSTLFGTRAIFLYIPSGSTDSCEAYLTDSYFTP